MAVRGRWLLIVLWMALPVATPFEGRAEANPCSRLLGSVAQRIVLPLRTQDRLADVLTRIPQEPIKKILRPHFVSDPTKLPKDRSWPILGTLQRFYYRWALQKFGRAYDPLADLLTRASAVELQVARQLALGEPAKLISESQGLADTLVYLTQGLPEYDALVVLKHYFGDPSAKTKKDPIDFLARLRALGAVGITQADFAAIAEKMKGKTKKGLSDKGKLDAFKDGIAETIGTRLPGTAKGIRTLDEVTALMEPGISGSIFENWANTHFYSLSHGALGRFHLEFDKVKGGGNFHNSALFSDNMLDAGAFYDLVEFKHLRTSQEFGEREIEQMKNYRELKRIGHKLKPADSTDARPLGKVRYLFSGKDAAEKNRNLIRQILQADAVITYVDHESGKIVELN